MCSGSGFQVQYIKTLGRLKGEAGGLTKIRKTNSMLFMTKNFNEDYLFIPLK